MQILCKTCPTYFQTLKTSCAIKYQFLHATFNFLFNIFPFPLKQENIQMWFKAQFVKHEKLWYRIRKHRIMNYSISFGLLHFTQFHRSCHSNQNEIHSTLDILGVSSKNEVENTNFVLSRLLIVIKLKFNIIYIH